MVLTARMVTTRAVSFLRRAPAVESTSGEWYVGYEFYRVLCVMHRLVAALDPALRDSVLSLLSSVLRTSSVRSVVTHATTVDPEDPLFMVYRTTPAESGYRALSYDDGLPDEVPCQQGGGPSLLPGPPPPSNQ